MTVTTAIDPAQAHLEALMAMARKRDTRLQNGDPSAHAGLNVDAAAT